eukprot:TRINITY_DN16618_c0_g2_i1.p1 TRINITY_DN16618_c0_g2~~TRINITY_DN16618_c0_g2_i1.p1  ORF type:complete len:501 (+),score=178.00 TRINITY_DN16618_c0_g2_i1:1840-3342(+)
MRHTLVRCCWKPSMPARADPQRVRELGMRGDYGAVTQGDVHPELNWRRHANPPLFASDTDNVAYGAGQHLADVLTNGVEAGVERTELETHKKGYHRARMTQGGHGVLGSEFYEESIRAMPHNTHQFKVRHRNVHEDWETTKWEGKYECIKRVIAFDNTRHPFFLYNRIFDHTFVVGNHCPVEVRLEGNTCTVYLTTTYVQGVSQLDFDMARFIDKERELMRRVDWTPVVRKKYEDGTRSYELAKEVEQRDLSEVNTTLSHKAFVRKLSGDWTVQENERACATHIVHSWARAMDVVNNVLELSEQVSTPPVYIRVLVHTVEVCIDFGDKAGRFLAVAVDGVLADHAEYLQGRWNEEKARLEKGSSTEQQRGHLADTNPAPQAYFVKNPLGEGHGPMRKVNFDQPSDEEAFQKRLAWGSLLPEDVRRLKAVAADENLDDKARAHIEKVLQQQRDVQAHPIDARRARDLGALRGSYKKRPDLVETIRTGLQRNERLKDAPSLQ